MSLQNNRLPPIVLCLDQSTVAEPLAELQSLLPKLRDRFPEVFDDFINALEVGCELFRLENGPATAGKLTILAKPSDGLAMLLTALRASEINTSLVEEALRHLKSPSGLDATMVTESPAGEQPVGDEDSRF